MEIDTMSIVLGFLLLMNPYESLRSWTLSWLEQWNHSAAFQIWILHIVETFTGPHEEHTTTQVKRDPRILSPSKLTSWTLWVLSTLPSNLTKFSKTNSSQRSILTGTGSKAHCSAWAGRDGATPDISCVGQGCFWACRHQYGSKLGARNVIYIYNIHIILYYVQNRGDLVSRCWHHSNIQT